MTPFKRHSRSTKTNYPVDGDLRLSLGIGLGDLKKKKDRPMMKERADKDDVEASEIRPTTKKSNSKI